MFWMITCLVLLSSSYHGYYGFYPYHVLQPQHEDQYRVLQLQPRNNQPCTLARNMFPTINTRARISLVILYTALVLLYYGLENNRLAADVVQPRSVFNNGTFPHDMCSESPDKMGRSYYYCVYIECNYMSTSQVSASQDHHALEEEEEKVLAASPQAMEPAVTLLTILIPPQQLVLHLKKIPDCKNPSILR